MRGHWPFCPGPVRGQTLAASSARPSQNQTRELVNSWKNLTKNNNKISTGSNKKKMNENYNIKNNDNTLISKHVADDEYIEI